MPVYAFENESSFQNDHKLQTGHVPTGLLDDEPVERPSIALAFSGGGARGLAHIGILQVFEEEGIPVDFIAGTSMGAVVAGLYSLGYNPYELEKLTSRLEWSVVFTDAPPRRNLFLAQKEIAKQELITLRFKNMKPFIPDAIVKGQTLFLTLQRLALNAPYYNSGASFDSLKVPISVVATDLNNSERVLLHAGDLPVLLRGAMAVPIIFRPLRFDEYMLVDGGAVENIPSRAARESNADIIIAVDCITPEIPELNPDEIWEVANQVTTLMTVTNDSISRSQADYLIEPDLRGIGNADFDKALDIISAGREAAKKAMPAIKKLYGNISRPVSKQVKLERIRINGIGSTQKNEINEIMNLNVGNTTIAEINVALEKLLRYLRREGFGAAKIETTFEDGFLDIKIDKGIVRYWVIEGIPERQWGYVQREIRLEVGEPLNTERLLQTISQLHASGKYAVAYSYLEPHPENGVIVHFLLEEAVFPKLGIGLGYDSDRKARYFLEFGLRPDLFASGEEIRIRAVYGERDINFSLNGRVDRVSRTYLGLEGSMEAEFHERDIFDDEGEVLDEEDFRFLRLNLGARFNLRTWGIVSAGIVSEQVQSEIANQYDTRYYNGIHFKTAFDTKDNKYFPRIGTMLELNYKAHPSWTKSARSFNVFTFKAEGVLPLQRRLVTRVAFRGGVADKTTPSSHQLSIGGIQDFPAYRPDRFISLTKLAGTLEFRYDLISRFVADAFILTRTDIAAFSDDTDWWPEKNDLLYSFAVGFALDTMLGPIEIWYARTANEKEVPRAYRITANVGYRF